MIECDVSQCRGICCTFLSHHAMRKDEDFKRYMRLHGVEISEDKSGLWLKLPLPCRNFDSQTMRCTNYKDRPKACRDYPKHASSPFITSKVCPLMKQP